VILRMYGLISLTWCHNVDVNFLIFFIAFLELPTILHQIA